jgi:uncharacterized protein (TIGR03067 family)
MLRRAIGLVMLTFALVIPTRATGQGAAPDEKLLGTWSLVSFETMGKTESLPEGQVTLIFTKDGKVTRKIKDDKDKEGTWKVATAKDPKEIDLVFAEDDGKKQETTKAIYKIDGDKLILAIPLKEPDGDRPTAFDSKQASIGTLKKQKP